MKKKSTKREDLERRIANQEERNRKNEQECKKLKEQIRKGNKKLQELEKELKALLYDELTAASKEQEQESAVQSIEENSRKEDYVTSNNGEAPFSSSWQKNL